jgi:DNA-binding transcriptional MerR regulator
MTTEKKIPNKLFFKIGEVCEITDTQPYVLRYWESEFPSLAPAKNSSGQRIYRRRDIETVLRIKQLLYEEGFTIAGAKKRLEAEMAGRVETPSPASPSGEGAVTPQSLAGQKAPTPDPAPDLPSADDPASDLSIAATRAALKEVREGLRDILTLLDRNDRNRT